ncbi:MAG TPA: hypothetical protein VGM91_17565 [Conexibacter sp.]|jgi:hypothetical protein
MGLLGGAAVPLAAELVDWGQLLDVVAVGLLAGVGLSIAFSLVILGGVRAGERRAESRALAATLYGTLAIAAAAVCVGAIVFGVSTMLAK